MAVGFDNGIRVEYGAVEQVEDVTTDDRSPGQEPPVDREAVWPKSIDHNSWKNTKREAVRETAEAGHDPEVVWVVDASCKELINRKDKGCDDNTPEARVSETLDDEVGANSRGQTTEEGAERDDRDVPKLAVCNKFFARGLVKVTPKCLNIVTNVTSEVSISRRRPLVRNVLDRHDTNACQ